MLFQARAGDGAGVAERVYDYLLSSDSSEFILARGRAHSTTCGQREESGRSVENKVLLNILVLSSFAFVPQ